MIKFITILYYNESEINDLFHSIKDNIADFKLIISLNSPFTNVIEDKRVRYIGDQTNIGFGKGINRALNLISKDEIVCIINSDVRFISIDLNHLKINLDNGFLIGPACFDNYHVRQDTFRKDISFLRIISRILKRFFLNEKGSLSFEYKLENKILVDWVIGGVIFVHGKDFIKLKGFDPSYFMYLEDMDFCIRARKTGLKILYSNDFKCNYRADRKSLKLNNLKGLNLFFYHIQSLFIFSSKFPKIFFRLT